MKVCVCVLFESPTEDDRLEMYAFGKKLTKDSESVRVFAGAEPGWLVVEFTMKNEPQNKAVDRIDALLRIELENRLDTTIQFPRTQAEIDRARREAEKRRAKRRMMG